MGRLAHRDDVIDHRGDGPAPNAMWMPCEVLGPKLAPIGVVASLPGARPLGVMLGLADAVPLDLADATLPGRDDLAARADPGSAPRHQATGLSTALPLMATTLAKIEVPLPLVRTGRT